jgi:hypothetical protein
VPVGPHIICQEVHHVVTFVCLAVIAVRWGIWGSWNRCRPHTNTTGRAITL